MVRKVFKAGNSMVVSLPRDVMESLGMKAGSEVWVKLDQEHGQVVIKPVKKPVTTDGVDEEFARQVGEFISEHRPALKSLAKK